VAGDCGVKGQESDILMDFINSVIDDYE